MINDASYRSKFNSAETKNNGKMRIKPVLILSEEKENTGHITNKPFHDRRVESRNEGLKCSIEYQNSRNV